MTTENTKTKLHRKFVKLQYLWKCGQSCRIASITMVTTHQLCGLLQVVRRSWIFVQWLRAHWAVQPSIVSSFQSSHWGKRACSVCGCWCLCVCSLHTGGCMRFLPVCNMFCVGPRWGWNPWLSPSKWCSGASLLKRMLYVDRQRVEGSEDSIDSFLPSGLLQVWRSNHQDLVGWPSERHSATLEAVAFILIFGQCVCFLCLSLWSWWASLHLLSNSHSSPGFFLSKLFSGGMFFFSIFVKWSSTLGVFRMTLSLSLSLSRSLSSEIMSSVICWSGGGRRSAERSWTVCNRRRDGWEVCPWLFFFFFFLLCYFCYLPHRMWGEQCLCRHDRKFPGGVWCPNLTLWGFSSPNNSWTC